MADKNEKLRQAREIIVDLSKLIDEHQARAAFGAERLQRALERVRAICDHARTVAVAIPQILRDALPGGPTRMRFCLDCGEADTGLMFGNKTGQMYTDRFSVLTGEPIGELPESELEHLAERLNFRGRFDEFDANGRWIDPDGGPRDDEN